MKGAGMMRRFLAGIRIITVVLSVVLVGGWYTYLRANETSAAYIKDFWTVMASLAPTLMIAYVVAIADSLKTYTNLKDWESQDWDRTDRVHQNAPIRITVAFMGGSVGIAFALLQGVVVNFALRAVLTGKTTADPEAL